RLHEHYARFAEQFPGNNYPIFRCTDGVDTARVVLHINGAVHAHRKQPLRVGHRLYRKFSPIPSQQMIGCDKQCSVFTRKYRPDLPKYAVRPEPIWPQGVKLPLPICNLIEPSEVTECSGPQPVTRIEAQCA